MLLVNHKECDSLHACTCQLEVLNIGTCLPAALQMPCLLVEMNHVLVVACTAVGGCSVFVSTQTSSIYNHTACDKPVHLGVPTSSFRRHKTEQPDSKHSKRNAKQTWRM